MIQVQKAKIEDILCIHDMAEIVFRHTYCDILSPEQIEYMMDWMYSPESLKRQMDEGHVYYIAYRDGAPCGYVSVQPDGLTDDGLPLFHLQKIYVLPSEQGTGLGRVLLETVLEHVRASVAAGLPAGVGTGVAAGVGTGIGTGVGGSSAEGAVVAFGPENGNVVPEVRAMIELNVNRNNPAIGFYHRFGFQILRQGDFPIGNGYYMNDYIMGLEVRS